MGIRRKLASWRLFRRPHRSPRWSSWGSVGSLTKKNLGETSKAWDWNIDPYIYIYYVLYIYMYIYMDNIYIYIQNIYIYIDNIYIYDNIYIWQYIYIYMTISQMDPHGFWKNYHWVYKISISFNGKLVGGWPTPLKNTKVNGKDDIPYIMENKKCLKPPTSWCFLIFPGLLTNSWSRNLGLVKPAARTTSPAELLNW